MTDTTDHTALSLALTNAVRRVDGVSDVYSSAPPLTATLSKVTQLVTHGDVGPELVALHESDGELVVAVTIGVSEGSSATEVCRDVYDVIEEHLTGYAAAAAGAAPPARIAVKVGRIG